MIKGVIFDIDNTLTDFMKMKRAAVDSAVEGMIDAGLKVEKAKMVEKIFELYWKEGVEDQKIFDKVLTRAIVGYRRAKAGTMALYPHVGMTISELMKLGVKMAVISDAPRL